MTTTEDLSARLYVRLYTSLLDDDDMVELSYAAVGVYAVTLLLTKHTAADGQVSLKLLRRDAALRPGTPLEEVLEELADAGLVTVTDGVVTVRSWAKYNALSAEIVAKRVARRESARRANHERWHGGPFEECPRCEQSVSPSESESDPPGSAPDPPQNPYSKSKSKSKSKSHSHCDGPDPDLWTTPDDPEPAGAAAADAGADAATAAAAAAAEAVELADQLMVKAGILDQEHAPDGIVRRVRRARANGWPIAMLEDRAVDVAESADRSPIGLLRIKLDDLANNPGPAGGDPPGGGSDWLRAWDAAVAPFDGFCFGWRGQDLDAAGLTPRTVTVIRQIAWLFDDPDTTGHDIQAAFRHAWLTAEAVP